MQKKTIVSVCLLLIVLAGILYWLTRSGHRSEKSPEAKAAAANPVPALPTQVPSIDKASSAAQPLEYPQLSLKNQSRDAAVKEWFKKHNEDRLFDWKISIRFYGLVVDQNNQPVAEASVHFQWTDLSEKGTSEADTTSDARGFFALLNQKGKNLGVYVSKQGYYDASRQENQTSSPAAILGDIGQGAKDATAIFG